MRYDAFGGWRLRNISNELKERICFDIIVEYYDLNLYSLGTDVLQAHAILKNNAISWASDNAIFGHMQI